MRSPSFHISSSTLEKVLETYSLADILELNELTEVEALQFLVDEEFVMLPENLPVDLEGV